MLSLTGICPWTKMSVSICQAVLETVARVKSKKNETKEEKYVLSSHV